jgi:2-polyprenyl-6-methoxyphenol hydroxylase-like FAD-dependent oxidoreductase
LHNHHIQPAWPAETHVAIVGAGPAGCVTALACAEQGLEVLLLEAREKVTERFGGEWLHPAGLKVLQRHGVGVHGPEHHSVPARGFAVIPEAGGEPIVLDYPREQAAVCIEHGRLIAALWEVVASHPKINFVHATRVAKLEPESAGVKLISESGRICHARRLVGADGRHSIVRTSLGQSAPPRTVSYTAGIRMEGVRLPIEGHGHVCLGGLGPVLMYQLGEQSVRACFDVPSAHMHTRNLAALLWDAYCPVVPASMHQAFLDALRHKPILWAANQHHPRTYAGDANRALVGDAAGCFHPLTAVGMTLGFLDGECLARCRSLAAYQTERLAESRVPATLAQALYKVFSGHSEDAVTVRRSVLELWRTSPAERERTMRLLSGEDARTLSFGAALLKVFSLAIRENSSGRPLGERLKLPVRMLAGFRPDTAGLESDGFHPLVAHDTKSAAAIGADEPRKPMGEQGESVDASTALERATDALIAHQSPSGNWEGEVVWSSMLGAQYALTHALLGRPLSASQRDALLRDFHSTQLPSGGWGMHPCSEPYLFNTALVYVASRLVGMDQDAPMLQRARAWIQAQGGVGAIPTWGKFWLALFNLYSWEGINPLLPEAWALPRWMPVHPGNFYCHTRLIYAGMSAIYASKHQMPLSPLLEEIRKELYLVPYSEIPFPRLAGQIRSAEVVMPPSRRLRFCFRLARVFERNHSAKLRRKVLEKLHDEIRFDLGQTDYGSISPVSGLLNIIALWLRDARDPDVERALAALRRWTWEDERGRPSRLAAARGHAPRR